MKTINNILIYGAVAAMSLLGSCTKGIEEQDGGELAPGTVQVQLVVPTGEQNKNNSRAATPSTTAEDFIDNVQMLFWETGENSIGRYIYIDPKKPVEDVGTVWNPATGTLTIRNSGFSDCFIYVMVNGKGDELSKEFKTQAEILDVIAEHSWAIIDPATNPLPMSGISPKVTFNDENTTQVTVELRRMVAKVNVTVNLDADFLKAYPDCEFGTAAGQAATLQLVNTSSKSYVFQKTPIVLPKNALNASSLSDMPVKENGTAKDKTWTATAYVFENPTADPATSMKLALNMPYKIGADTLKVSNNYEVEINHAATADRVLRNYIYDMTMTVNGFGENNMIETAVEITPWDEQSYDDQISGAKLGVNFSTINVRGVANTQLVVTSDDLSKVEFTDYAPLLTKPTIDPITGAVSVNTAIPIGLYTANYTTFTVKRGGITKTITVHAGLWAKGNVIYSNGKYINSTNPLDNGLYFFAGSQVGLLYGVTTAGAAWSNASKYYDPADDGTIAEKTGVSWNATELKIQGDPCRFVAPLGEWRLPTKSEFENNLLDRTPSVIADNIQKYYGGTVAFRWAGAAVSGNVEFYGTNGLYYGKNGDTNGRMEFYANNNPNSWSNGLLISDNFTVRCVHN